MDTNATMIPFYKERVEKIEKEILAIANNAPYVDFRRTRQQLDEQTNALVASGNFANAAANNHATPIRT